MRAQSCTCAFALAAALTISCGTRKHNEFAGTAVTDTSRAAADTSRADAFALATSVVQAPLGSSGRLPLFLTWSTREEMKACTGRTHRTGFRLDAALPHVDPALLTFNFDPTTFDKLGFYYSDLAQTRFCAPAIQTAGAPVVISPQVWKWWNLRGNVPDHVDPFPAGARAAVSIFTPIYRRDFAGSSTVGVDYYTRTQDDVIQSQSLTVSLPQTVLAKPDCPALLKQLRNPPAMDRRLKHADGQATSHLDDFYWVQLEVQDQSSQGQCGDLLILVGFHVIEKQMDGRWLWSTFWWDPNPPVRFSTTTLGMIHGAGSNPAAWQHYAMDAQYGTAKPIFNPWKDEPKDSNCEFCHLEAIVPRIPQVSGSGTPPRLPPKSLSFDLLYAGPTAQMQP